MVSVFKTETLIHWAYCLCLQQFFFANENFFGTTFFFNLPDPLYDISIDFFLTISFWKNAFYWGSHTNHLLLATIQKLCKKIFFFFEEEKFRFVAVDRDHVFVFSSWKIVCHFVFDGKEHEIEIVQWIE